MPFVLDASVAVSWCFPDESDPRAAIAWALLLGEESALVPPLWWFEIRNIAIVGERRRRITADRVDHFIQRIERLLIVIRPIPESNDLMLLARRSGLSLYDATYLELAKREDLPLATLDRGLARAARTEGVAVIGDS